MCMYVCMCVYICIYVCVYMCYVYVYVYVYVHICFSASMIYLISKPNLINKKALPHLIFNMGIPTPGKEGLYIETGALVFFTPHGSVNETCMTQHPIPLPSVRADIFSVKVRLKYHALPITTEFLLACFNRLGSGMVDQHWLQWCHNERNGISNHQSHGCLLNRLSRRRSKKTSKVCVTGLCAGNSPGTGEFPAQRASNAENVSIWWRHHG